MRARRAFTLVELLLVVGVLVALATVALPYGLRVLDGRTFERAVDDTVSQAQAARAWAQRRGAIVELVVANEGSGIEARAVDLLRDAEDGPGPASADGMEQALRGSRGAQRLRAQVERRIADVAARTGVRAEVGGGPDDAGFDPVIHEDWAVHALDTGIAAGTDDPRAVEPGTTVPDAAPASGDRRVALFLPDGSAAAVRPLWIAMDGRTVRIDIDPLLGEVRRTDAPPAADGGTADRLDGARAARRRSAP